MPDLERIAASFVHAFYENAWPENAGFEFEALSNADAYRVQALVAQTRLDRGEQIAGYKVGCTSAAIRSQFGLTSPIYAPIFSPRIHDSDTSLNLANYVGCAIEPELVFEIRCELQGESLSDDDLIDAIASVRPGIELHNYRFWRQPPCLSELICSGGIHAGLVVGEIGVAPETIDFANAKFRVMLDGQMVAEEAGREIMGGPLKSLRWLVEALTQQGKSLAPGQLVIPGSPTPLIPIASGKASQLTVDIEGVGIVRSDFF